MISSRPTSMPTIISHLAVSGNPVIAPLDATYGPKAGPMLKIAVQAPVTLA